MKSENTKISRSMILITFIYILAFPAALLFISGNWFWVQGWIFSLWFLIVCYSTIIYLYQNDPSLLAERYRKPGTGGKKKDGIHML